MIGLQHEMTYRLRIRGPTKSTRGSPRGECQYWEMAEGTLTGDRIRAHIAMPSERGSALHRPAKPQALDQGFAHRLPWERPCVYPLWRQSER
jgi:hypothetical protein